MKHVFRGQMTNTELVSRLMATANKQGIYADSRIYGEGLMDLGAATAPFWFSLGGFAAEGAGPGLAARLHGAATDRPGDRLLHPAMHRTSHPARLPTSE